MRNILKSIVLMAAVTLPLVSCVRELESPEPEMRPVSRNMTFTAAQADSEPATKTVRNEDGSLSWLPADEINVFCGAYTSGRFISDNEEPADRTTFTGHFDEDVPAGVQNTYYAVYPYSPANTFDGSAVTLAVPSVQVSEAGSFGAGMYPSVARSTSTSLAFRNVCGGIKFSVSRSDITDITIAAKGEEPLSGQVKVSFGADGVPAVSVTEGISEVTVRPSEGGCFKPGEYYYMTILPVTMANGFTMTFNTDDGKQGILESSKSVTIKRSVFSKKDNIDSGVADWTDRKDNPDYSDSGIYLGILGFNQALYTCPVTLLTPTSVSQAKSFIDGLQMKNGTILYYAADNGLVNMQAASYPGNLASASLVTFTDGLDQGSLMMNWDYDTDEKYLSAVSTRIRKGSVAGLPLSAYSIGIKGNDVTNVTKFKDNLTKLASSEENAYEISNMSELNSKFESIANLASVAVEYTHDVTLAIPGLPDGTKVRFTFDNVSGAEESQIYIEGTFNLKYRSLTGVTYHGLTCASGTSVTGTVDDIFVRFVFSKVRCNDRKELTRDYLKQWQCEKGSSKWQINSEFDKMADTDIDVTFVQKSAAVYLVLDCSNSLGSQFSTMKTYVKDFIQKLYDDSYIDKSVKSVRISADEITLNKGERRKLSAVVYPVTAQDRSVIWSSGNGSVATVDANGNVTGVGAGSADICVRTNDGEHCEYCTVKVYDSPSNPQGQGDFSHSGLYLGVLAFNRGLYEYPICRLTEEIAASINAFIDGVAQRDGSVLCYAVDEAVTGIQAPKYPSDLSSAAMVTFTDGLDQGSLMKNGSYTSNDAYLSYVNGRISSAKANKIPVTAYSIGIRGNDVTDIDKYRSDLAKLASSESNAYEITDIFDLKSKLNAIADVVKVTYEYSYGISLTIPGPANGTRVRFTFDNVNDASKSTKYIEGTFNLKNRTLTDITYKGLSSSSESTVTGIASGIFVTFNFSDVTMADGSELTNRYVKEWTSDSSSSGWQINSEFDSGSDTHVSSEVHRKSGVVYLVLDCSTSLGSKIGTVKDDAKNFVNTLQRKSYDQYAVSSVSLSHNQLAISAGQNAQLSAIVNPSSALDKSVTWNSSNPSVASVSPDGFVLGVSEGVATITVKTNEGGYTASCEVSVIDCSTPEYIVDLGLLSGIKWSSCNLGASKPEQYGCYYQWSGLQDVTSTSIYLDYSICPYHIGSGFTTGWTKYIPSNWSSYWSGPGSLDNKIVLDPEDDVAHVKLGGKWRMPTMDDWRELMNNCTSEWTTMNGVSGLKFISKKNGNSIFLPAAGARSRDSLNDVGSYGDYWSSSLFTYYPSCAYYMYFSSGSLNYGDTGRHNGLSVRPVYLDLVMTTGISLDKTSLFLSPGDNVQLTASLTPSNCTNKELVWSSNNTSVATVSDSGLVSVKSFGSADITVTWAGDSNLKAICTVTVTRSYLIPEMVDLDLPSGLKWSSFNLGATKPEEYGGYYQWGGLQDVTDTNIILSWDNCPYHTGSDMKTCWMKYIPSGDLSFWSGSGSPDNKTVLDLNDDVAHAKLGGKWRMPTMDEWLELMNNCTSEWTTMNGVYGRKFISNKNGNSIFLPAAGNRSYRYFYDDVGSNGDYWSSSLDIYPSCAHAMDFRSDSYYVGGDMRYLGQSVRPVSE